MAPSELNAHCCPPEGRSVSLLRPQGRSVSLLSPRRPLGSAIVPPKAARFRYCPPEGRSVSLLSALFPLLWLLLNSQIALRTGHFELSIKPSTPLPTASPLCG